MKLLTLFFIIFTYTLNAQCVDPVDSSGIARKIDKMDSDEFQNKDIPSEYEYSIKEALTFYPKLKTNKIKFKYCKISTTLNARPTVASLLFRRKSKRSYVIRINNSEKDSMVTLNEVPFFARIGLFGHEFAHFADYQEKNLFQVIGRLFAYTSKSKKELFEKEIDTKTIERGLGCSLHSWSYFVQFESDASEDYKTFKRQIYLEPTEIKELMNQQ